MPQNDPAHIQVFDPDNPPPPYTGPALTPWQYEALCRHALSREYDVSIDNIKTGYLEVATTTQEKTRHQLDLYWTVCDGVCNYLCFANAKFRKNKVAQTEIMTLLGVQRDIRAHKAMMITNTGYSHSALVHARDKGIALLIVRPNPDFKFDLLPEKPAPAVAVALERLSLAGGPLYNLTVIHRGFDPGRSTGPAPSSHPLAPSPTLPLRARPPVPQSAFSNQHSAIPNKMIPSSPPAPRASAAFGIRRKGT